MSVMIVTSLGDIVVDLFTDRCPLTCKNFLKLCKIKYYNGCLFHSVQKDFTTQTGDPTGIGSGGDSVYNEGEQDCEAVKRRWRRDRSGAPPPIAVTQISDATSPPPHQGFTTTVSRQQKADPWPFHNPVLLRRPWR